MRLALTLVGECSVALTLLGECCVALTLLGECSVALTLVGERKEFTLSHISSSRNVEGSLPPPPHRVR